MSGKHVASKPVRRINTSKGVKLAAGSALALSVVIGAPTMALASPATETPAPTSTGTTFTTQAPASSTATEADVQTPVTLEAPIRDSELTLSTPLTEAETSSRGAVTCVWTISGETPGQEVWMSIRG